MNFHALSDGLANLSRDLDEFTHGGLALDGETAHQLACMVGEYKRMALKLEHEISRHRWNGAARADRDAMAEAIIAEAERPGTNLLLLARMDLPFGDHPAGGTA